MPDTVVHEEAFQRAQDRAREERLRRAIERELNAHRSLCQHYNKAIEHIVELEERESRKIAELESALAQSTQELERLRQAAKRASSGLRILGVCVILSAVAVFFLNK